MGYKSSINNNVRNNIKKSIKTLLATNIANCYKGGLYNIKSKNYITDTSKKYQFIERCINYHKADTTYNLSRDNIEKIKINKFFYEMIINGHIIIYNIWDSLSPIRWAGKD